MMSPARRGDESAMHRDATLTKMSLKRNSSDFSHALQQSGITGWKDKLSPTPKLTYALQHDSNEFSP